MSEAEIFSNGMFLGIFLGIFIALFFVFLPNVIKKTRRKLENFIDQRIQVVDERLHKSERIDNIYKALDRRLTDIHDRLLTLEERVVKSKKSHTEKFNEEQVHPSNYHLP